MDYVKEFNKGNIMLDIVHSSPADLEYLSRLCPSYDNLFGFRFSLIEYIKDGIKDRKYEVVFYSKDFNSYDAFRLVPENGFIRGLPVMTADKILNYKDAEINIEELDLEEMFR